MNDTRVRDTPARVATSAIVGRRCGRPLAADVGVTLSSFDCDG
jgi:hypothetical protein